MVSLKDIMKSGHSIGPESFSEHPELLAELEYFIHYIRTRRAGDHGEIALLCHVLSGRSIPEIIEIFQDPQPHLGSDRVRNLFDLLDAAALKHRINGHHPGIR